MAGADRLREGIRSVRRVATRDRARTAAAAVSVVSAVAVYLIAVGLFPYHSLNHDEGVYLQQAALLLEGQFALSPPTVEAFRPWFFVADGTRLYPKYAPVPAAMFALGKLAGGYRLALAAIGGAVPWLTYVVVREVFDGPTGAVAAGFVVASPLFLIQAATFLPYVPTAALNLTFAAAYLRADRTGSHRWAAVAGAAVGLAFFARPYTAVLFAVPFVAHALWTLRRLDRDAVGRQAVTAALGLTGVGTALAYNAAVTGDPLLFPYQAFAPNDGLEFGRHRLLGYSLVYTPDLALAATVASLRAYATHWVAGGALGVAAALGGLGAVAVRWRSRLDRRAVVLAGVAVTVVVGEAYFWGILNALGDLERTGDGLIAYLGPYYHFDLLLPTAAFAARGSVVGWRGLRAVLVDRIDPGTARVALGVALVVAVAVTGAATVEAGREPVKRNAGVTEELAAAYEPVQGRSLSDAVVFLPTPYGDWLNHPFQALRNDPGYDQGPVYALREDQFAVVDAFPDRRLLRYSFRGGWAPFAGDPVTPRLRPVDHVAGRAVAVRTRLGIPADARRVSIRLVTDAGQAYYAGTPDDGTLSVTVRVTDGTARLTGEVEALGDGRVPVGDRDRVALRAFVDRGAGAGFTYRVATPVAAAPDGGVRALSPLLEWCRVPARCGGAAAYVPATAPPGLAIETTIRANRTGRTARTSPEFDHDD